MPLRCHRGMVHGVRIPLLVCRQRNRSGFLQALSTCKTWMYVPCVHAGTLRSQRWMVGALEVAFRLLWASMRVPGTKQMFSAGVLSCWALSPALYLTVVETESFPGRKLVKKPRLAGHWAPGDPLSQPSQQWHHKHAPHLTFLPLEFWESSWGSCDFSAGTLHDQLSLQLWIIFFFKAPGHT